MKLMIPNPERRKLSLLLLSLCGVCSTLWAEQSTQPLTADQLLARFAEAREQLKSFIVVTESSLQDELLAPRPWKGRSTAVSETRFQNGRLSVRDTIRGQVGPEIQFAQDKPAYNSLLIDGQFLYQYNQARDGAGMLLLREPPKVQGSVELLCRYGSGLELGLGLLPHDSEPFDRRLRQAATIRVREKLEAAGWVPSPCYVLEADTPHGHYTVWLDPAHGYQMAKGILRRRPGHQRSTGYTLQKDESDFSLVEKVRFAKSGNLWVPMEGIGGLDNTFSATNRSRTRFQHKVTKILLNPDHEALHSFVPDDIRDGAKVNINRRERPTGGLIWYKWQEGQILDDTGQVMLTPSPRLIAPRHKPNLL